MNWVNLYKKHAGKWVALKEDEKTVIASAATARAAYKKAKDSGLPHAFITRVPKTLTSFVGANEVSLIKNYLQT